MKTVKRAFALMLTALMLFELIPAVPIAADAKTYGDFVYVVTNREVAIIEYLEYATGAVDIPSTIRGYPVTTIGINLFYECSRLTSVNIPDSVTSIAESACRQK